MSDILYLQLHFYPDKNSHVVSPHGRHTFVCSDKLYYSIRQPADGIQKTTGGKITRRSFTCLHPDFPELPLVGPP